MKCPNEEWIHYGPSCYKAFGFNYDSMDARSFSEARAYCQSQGGDLMSVGSKEEEDSVLKRMEDEQKVYGIFWIGLSRIVGATGEDYVNDYEWVDETLKDFNHFAGNYFHPSTS